MEMCVLIIYMWAHFKRLTVELGQAYSGIDEEEVEADIKEAIQAIRKG